MKRIAIVGLGLGSVLLLVCGLLVGFSDAGEFTGKTELFQILRNVFVDPENQEVAWVTRVKLGPEVGFLEDTCESYRSFSSKEWAFVRMQEVGFTWEEFGLPHSFLDARLKFQEEGKSVARKLIVALKMPLQVRQRHSYCSDGLTEFADGIRVFEILLDVLQTAKAEPADIQTTEEQLRVLVLGELRIQAESVIAKPDSHERAREYGYVVKKTLEMNFPLEEVGIQHKEYEGLLKSSAK